MASTSEVSYGSRLRRARDLITYLAGFEGYGPPREEESIESLKALITEITSAGESLKNAVQVYNAAVTNRYNAFRNEETGLFRIIVPLRAIVQAQYGKGSLQYNQLARVIGQLRKGKVRVVSAGDGVTEKRISQSEQSFGNATLIFSDLIQTLLTFEGYQPARTELQIPSLMDTLAKVNELNDAVAASFQPLKTARDKRRTLHEDLSERVGRVKAYIKGNYGPRSQEYIMVKGLKI